MRKLVQKAATLCAITITSFSAHAHTTNYFVNGINNDRRAAQESAEILGHQQGIQSVDLLHNTSVNFTTDLREVISQVFNWDGYYADDGSVASDKYLATVLSSYFDSDLYNRSVGESVGKVVAMHQSLIKLGRNAEAQEIMEDTLSAIGCEKNPRSFGLGATTRLLSDYECEVLQFVNKDIYNLEDIVLALVTVDQKKGAIFLNKNLAYSDTNDWLSHMGDLAKNKINLACHSQGNEFCNRLATHIQGQGYGKNVKVLSIATPDNYVYGDGAYITLKEDLVSLGFLGSLPQNATNHTFAAYLKWFWVSSNLIKYGDITGHGFNESYMSSNSFSKEFIVRKYIANYDSLIADECPQCFVGTELNFGYIQGIWDSSDTESDHYYKGRAKDYTFRVTQACQKVSFLVGSEVDSYIDLRANGVLIGADDDGGVSTGAKLVRDLHGGVYDVEVTGKSLFSDSTLNRFGLTITNLGACDALDTSNIYASDFSIDGETSNIYLTYGQEIKMQAYQNYSGTVANSDLANPNVEYVFSRDMALSSDDIIVDTDFSTIGSDDISDIEQETYVISDALGIGRWYIGFVTDSDNEIPETNEDDNVAWIEVEISSGKPPLSEDVYVQNVSVSETIMYVGTEYRLRARQYYSGHQMTTDLSSIRLNYYLSDDIYYSLDDEYLGHDNSSIGSNDKYDSESFYWTPSSLDTGLGFIILRADASNIIDEQDEENNQKIIAIAVLE